MHRAIILAVLAFLALAALSPRPASAAAEPYTLNPGDTLFVSVWKEEELQRELVVLPDGTISFPLAGPVKVDGLTVDQVETALAGQLKRYIPDAVVTVTVMNASGYRVYVLGAVNRPGEYQVPRRITVMQALSLAGGLTPFAGEDSIHILRRDANGTTAIPFEYSEVKRGRDLEMDIELKSGDTVVVAGQSLF
jgi:polysaccharide biosynthesis/export protein